MNKVTAYFSHSIRGKKGKDATDEDMERNCNTAMRVATWIRESISGIDLYIPAEHEDFVAIAYKDKYLTEKQILEIDCKILKRQDFHIVYEVDEWLGGGIEVEINAAKKYRKPIFYVSELDEVTVVLLRQMIKDVLEMKERR